MSGHASGTPRQALLVAAANQVFSKDQYIDTGLLGDERSRHESAVGVADHHERTDLPR